MTSSYPPVEIDPALMAPLREICLAYPEAFESDAFGVPTFKVRTKNFAWLYSKDDVVSVLCKAPPGMQEAWIAADPARYARPPYLGLKGWIAAWVSPGCDPDWEAIAEIIDESYRLIAPKRLVALIAGPA